MEEEKALKLEDFKEKDNITQDDLDYIDKEMQEAVQEAYDEIEKEVEADEELNKEADEIFATDDINERIKIWKKYHPNEELTI